MAMSGLEGWACDGKIVSVAIRTDALEAALNCLSACADDEKEPERYRAWYRSAHDQIKAECGHLLPTAAEIIRADRDGWGDE